MNILQNIIPNKSSVYVFFQVSTKTCIKDRPYPGLWNKPEQIKNSWKHTEFVLWS